MVGRQLPFFSLIVPFWLIAAFAGLRGMVQVWPALLVAGVAFALPQYLVSNFHGPWLVDVVAAIVSMACLALLPQGLAPERALALGRRARQRRPGGVGAGRRRSRGAPS